MRENTWGAYQDALPGRWLVFHARGLYEAPRYACEEHRGDLVAYLREHYGTVGFHATRGAAPHRGNPLPRSGSSPMEARAPRRKAA